MLKNRNWNYYFPATIYVIMLIGIIAIIPYSIHHGINAPYKTFDISDWLINYQGGFVRRGLLGEGLLAFHSLFPISLKVIITMGSIAIFLLFIHRLWKVSTSLQMSLFPFLAMTWAIHNSIIWYRRDYLMLLMAFYLFHYVTGYINNRSTSQLIKAQVLSVLAIIIHESTFFFTIPLAFAVTALATIKEGTGKCRAVCTKLFTPPYWQCAQYV